MTTNITPTVDDLVTCFVFDGHEIVEISSAYEDSVLIEVKNANNPKDDGRKFELRPDEIDIFTAALNLYKNRILKRGGNT